MSAYIAPAFALLFLAIVALDALDALAFRKAWKELGDER